MKTQLKSRPSDVEHSAAYVEWLRTQPDGKRYLPSAEKRLDELRATVCDQHCLACDDFNIICVPNASVTGAAEPRTVDAVLDSES